MGLLRKKPRPNPPNVDNSTNTNDHPDQTVSMTTKTPGPAPAAAPDNRSDSNETKYTSIEDTPTPLKGVKEGSVKQVS